MKEIFIAKQSGAGFSVRRGDVVAIVDVEGEQVADFFAVNPDNHEEYFSTGITIESNGGLRIREGGFLHSNLFRRMFRVVEDKVGGHDLTIPCCRREAYEFYGQRLYHPNCLDNMNAALAAFRIPFFSSITALSVFMNVQTMPEGKFKFAPPLSKAGDRLVLRAEMDAVVAITACSADSGTCNGGRCKPVAAKVWDEAEWAAERNGGK